MTYFTAKEEVCIKTETTEVLRLPAEDTQTSTNLEATRPEKKSIMNNALSGADQNTSGTVNADEEHNYPTIVYWGTFHRPVTWGGGGGGLLTRPKWTKLSNCIFYCLDPFN